MTVLAQRTEDPDDRFLLNLLFNKTQRFPALQLIYLIFVVIIIVIIIFLTLHTTTCRDGRRPRFDFNWSHGFKIGGVRKADSDDKQW